ncbi:serine-rich adhesin for platelets-like isoform X1 [Cebidichthys violaceus]|uniref:serine-rich adhesin for platelets-like isoform X1 n=1 Tax=Cebidichthys violaceus TaxID=271503 RepID=UPI0035CB89E8
MSDVRSSTIVTAEQIEHLSYEERAGGRGLDEKEPLAIVFKDRLEKVERIQRSGINENRQVQGQDATKEKWSSLSETRSVEKKYPPVEEPVFQEICIEGTTSSRSATEVRDMTGMVSQLSIDMDQYLEERSVVTCGSLEDLVQDKFDQVIVKRDGKRRPPDIKKPVRKKLRDRERSGCSSSEGELERVSSEESLDGDVVLKESALLPTTVMDPPASPSVVETPIGSIKERLKALQNKAEEEGVNKDTQEVIPQAKYSIAKRKNEADMPELPRVPKSPKSPRSQTERLEETMSVKELMNAFQTGQDPSKSKAGLFEHKAVASSCISTLISESGDSDQIKRTEQSLMQEPNSQTQRLQHFYQESDINKSDKTAVDDQPVSLINDNSEESQLISHSASFGKTVKFADTIQCDDRSVSPQTEVPEKETMSVKELMKAFGTGHDPSKTKAGVSPCLSTMISESGDSEEINTINQNAPQEPKSQIQTQNLTIFYQQSDVKKCDKTDTEDQPVSLIRDNSKKSLFISDSTSFGKMVTFADTVQCDDRSVSPQRETSELSEKETLSVKELMKTFQSGNEPSKNKAGLYEHKAVASSCISTLISESGDSEEMEMSEQGATQKPKSQTQNLTSFHQQSDGKKCYTTDLRDLPASLSRDNSEEVQLISDRSHFGKTVTFADTIQCDNGNVSQQREASELSEKESMSVKDLMKAFQAGHDPSESQAGLYEHKVMASSISTLISESGNSEEIHTTAQRAEQSPMQESKSQQSVTIVYQESDVKKFDKTDLEDRPVSLIPDESEESQFISDGAYFGKTVTFADTVQCEDGGVIPQREASELSEKETTSVKELMKAFQTGQDPFKSKAGLGEHNASAYSCISTLISESVGPKEIQMTQHSPTQEPKSQSRIQNVTIFHPQSDIDICGTLDLEAQTINLMSDNSEELQLISDIAYFGETIEIDDTIQFDDVRILSQRKEPELSGKGRGRMQLEEPVIGTGRSLSEDLQISPDRRPSEDFSADIKAELEDSPEYQLFKQTSTAEDVSNQLEAPEEETMADSDTNPASISSPCIKSYFGEASLLDNQMKDDDLSSESPKHEGMAESSNLSVDIRTPRSSSEESENYEGLAVTDQMTNEMFTYTTRRKENYVIVSQEERLHKASKESTTIDHGSNIFFTQTDTEVTKVKIREPQLQEVHIERNTSSQASTAVKDMSGMLSLMSSELDQYLKARPVARQPPGEDIVQEKFEQTILIKDKNKETIAFVTDENTGATAGGKTKEIDHALTEEHPITWGGEEEEEEEGSEFKEFEEVNNTSGLLLVNDWNQYEEAMPVASQTIKKDNVQEKFEIFTSFTDENKGVTEDGTIQETDCAAVECKVTRKGEEMVRELRETKATLIEELPMKEEWVERKASYQPSSKVKDMSGMQSVLNSDLDRYLEDRSVKFTPPEEDVIQEKFEEVNLTKIHKSSREEQTITCEKTQRVAGSALQDNISGETYEQSDVVELKELTPSSLLETSFQEVCIERRIGHEPSTTERDMSGMLSLLSSDLDQYLEERPVAMQCHPEEDELVLECYKQVRLTSSDFDNKVYVEANEHMHADVIRVTELSPSSELETPFQEVFMERKSQQQPSATKRDMSGMMSLLSTDLNQYLKEKPVAIQLHPEEHIVHESCKEVFLTSSNLEDKIDLEANEHLQTNAVGVTELSPSSELETPFQEVCMERKTQQQQSATKKDMSGMLSLLSTDLNQYLKEKPMAIQLHPEEDLVHESCKEVFLTSNNLEDKVDVEANEHLQTNAVGVTELSTRSVLETPFQEVCMERKSQQQQSATERDVTGMLSLLSTDLNQYLKEKPVAIQLHTEEHIVHESCKEVFLTSSNLEDKIDVEENEHLQTNAVGVTELSTSSVLETPFQEVCTDRKTQQQQSATERDVTGMLSLLSTDLNQYLKEKPVVIHCQSKEEVVHESFEEVILTKDTNRETLSFSPEHKMMSQDKNADFVNLNEKGAIESGWQISSHEDERLKSFSSEEGEAKNSPCAASHCNDSTEGAVGITKPYMTMDDSKNDHKDVVTDDFLQLTNRSDTLQRPDNLVNLNTVFSGDPAKELCHQDSLESSPLMEDGSSNKSPDSIEPSPTGESPSPDSLEGSPTQSKDTELKMPVKTAVYEDYASQLKACYSSDKSFYRDESEQEEQENDYGIIQMESEIKDLHSFSAKTVTDGSMYSDTKICDSDNLHLLIRQDSLDADDSEDDTTNKQFTPEEEMFKMAAKIKTYEEMEQEAKIKRDKSETDDLRNDEPDLKDFAQLEAEKQVHICPGKDRNPPDKTLVQTSGNERTPDPFQFQEGKLFEMTRGGAIDMTRRSFDEGEGYAFFHIGEHPVDEVVQEETEECQTKYLALENSDYITDATLEEITKSYLTHGANDTIPTPKPRTLVKPSSDKSEREMPLSEADLGSSVEVQLGSPSALERLTNIQSEVGNFESLGLSYLDSTIADLQSDTSTVAHSAYSEQSHDSSDSSPDDDDDDDDDEEDEEDQCSVIEMSFAQAGIPAYHQDSPPSLEMTMKDSQKSQLDQVQRKAEKSSTLDRRTRSEADCGTSKASNKDCRSYSDSSEPTDKSNLSPFKLSVTMQQKPPAQAISSSSPQRKEIQLSKTTETSVRSSLDADHISSASHRSPDSVISTYDIAVSHSTDSEVNPLPGVPPSSGREDVIQSRPAWDATVETQMQRIFDEPAPDCTPVDWQDDADRKEETLAIVADLLGFSWTELARELEFSEVDIQLVRTENPNSLQEQSHALLQRWVEREGKHATEDCLIMRLTKINRMDIVHLIETQMNKSVQEQTSRTYAEIEKTLDHSEVSVALSLVQDDADSPRVVRRVESDRRPPPAVSEEDLSVASLLDIPSWAEPIGHTHSESMHGDLLEELEIPHELNPSLWTSEDVITEETTSYDNLDEQVSTASSRTSLSESSRQTNANLGQRQVFPIETPSIAHVSNTLSTEKLELPFPGAFDLSKTLSEITLTTHSNAPQQKDKRMSFAKQSENSGLAETISATPNPLCQTAQEIPDDQIITSSESTPTPPKSGSPQLDQLLSDLEEMNLKFRTETSDPLLLDCSDGSSEGDQMCEFNDLAPEDQCHTEESDNVRVSVSSAMQLAEDTNLTDVAVIEPAHFQTSIQDEPEVVTVTPDLTKTSETSVPSNIDSRKDSPLSPAEFLSTPECPQRFCEVMVSLNSSFPVDMIQSSTCDENATETPSSVSVAAKSLSDIPEEHLANLCEEDSTTGILQSPEKLESATSSKDSMGVTGEISTQSIQDKRTHLWEVTFVEAIQTEDVSSQSLSDLTPETVTSARHFSFEEVMSYPSPGNFEASSDEDRPRTSGQHSEESLTPVESECFASQPTPVKPKAERTSSTSDEGYSIPSGYTEISSTTAIYTHMPPEYAEVVHSGADSPTLEYSDPEPFFDCIQAASDFSETEPDEPEARTRSIGDQPHGHLCDLRVLEKVNRKILLSSGSEDYEDAPFVQEPPYNVHKEKEELLHYSETSDEEFTLCEASQPPPVCVGAYDDTVKSLTRDIVAELGSMSESSDDEFLTTRIVRRRVVIQADEMPDLPTQSVTEEKYKDENGHIVVKKVTRTIIRKCVSADGVEREEVSSEGAPQASIRMTAGDGYSKVVKRTVLKSEGDHTEVTFTECEGFSASNQEPAEGCTVSRVERTMVVEGERTMTHQGDLSLASDLPSAQKDFKQALGYISGFSRTELPRVVERKTVKEDGTVVRRAHMRKGRTHRRTVVKRAGKRKQVLLEQVDNPGRGSKPRDLQQHLHQLFHRYHEEEKDNDEEE